MSEGKRSVRVADVIRREVSGMLVRSIKDPRIGFVTVTKVSVTDDCRFARIYFSVPGTVEERERSLEGLNSARGFLRRELGKRLSLRYTPDIAFQFDPSVEYGIHMEELFRHLHQQEEGTKDPEDDDSP